MELGRRLRGNSTFPLLNQLSATASRFHIPVEHFYELIRGMEMDLRKTRYRTFDELREYCYLVASSVGLMCRKIFGYRNESTREYAINLGIALQLTNILRDIKDDAKRGRIYIPLEDMERFGYTEDDLLHSRYTPQFVELMRFECQRASEYFDLARAALQDEDKRFFFAARIMWSIYAHTLNRIIECRLQRVRAPDFHPEIPEGAHRLPLLAEPPTEVLLVETRSAVDRLDSHRDPVVIVGGGLSGLAAARPTSVPPASPCFSSSSARCRRTRVCSFTDSTTGDVVDNGQHLLIAGYTRTLALLDRIGSRHLLTVQERPVSAVPSSRAGVCGVPASGPSLPAASDLGHR